MPDTHSHTSIAETIHPDDPELAALSGRTIGHYERVAADFWEGTKDHDVSQNRAALLDALPSGQVLDILEFGCGPGRDVAWFASQGHRVVGLDGCASFCRMAHELTGAEVWRQDFLNLDLPPERFDGVFANASLFHIPRAHLTRVLTQLQQTLKPGGVLFSSNPRGAEEGWRGERYGTYLEYEPFCEHLRAAGLEPEHHYYRPPGLPRHEQPWLAMVSRKGRG
ncbi:class I SAM-dependent methyltransferase [Magnetofaba australis]|uniref:Putative type 11 methyltransferase n=1 Tax=Magnetofaba australis IT-1 TaxID=1434232 RepID=A0A1Y2K1S6_9PROT|nr:class I SAM-dependent methyltransferase [Magnetofaba australis]OSM01990.1 putative type 11 methyltransferase [Magnetofaba australis IT-1]